MSNFFLTPAALPATRRLLLRRMLLMGALLVGGSFCYGYFVLQEELLTCLVLCLVFVLVIAFSYSRSLRQQQAAIESFRLEVEPSYITRIQQNLPLLQLSSTDITSVTENYQGILTIATADKYRAIYVPAQVTNRPELLRELAAFAPLTVQAHKTLFEQIAPFINVAMLLLMGAFYFTTNKVFGTITGLLTLGVLAWSGWHIWRNPNITPQIRRARWMVPLVFLSILAMVVARLQQ